MMVILQKYCAVLVLLMVLSMPGYAQPLQDTLSIKKPGAYEVYRHLYILKTSENLTPQFIFENSDSLSFSKLYPHRSYNNTGSLIRHYWLLVTIKNTLCA